MFLLVNPFRSLKFKELKKEQLFKIIKLLKNMIDLTIKSYTHRLGIDKIELPLKVQKEIQKNLVVVLAAGPFGDY